MDLSIIAAVGSFVVSERVLKPKATVLVILGFLLAYDLTTKTHDVSSLRVYRGPSLVAFTLMMAAYSLRIWRRNGVACDELIFLPGTQHGLHNGIAGPLIETIESIESIPSGDGGGGGDIGDSNSNSNKKQQIEPIIIKMDANANANANANFSHSYSKDDNDLEMISLAPNNSNGNASADASEININDKISIVVEEETNNAEVNKSEERGNWNDDDDDDDDEDENDETTLLGSPTKTSLDRNRNRNRNTPGVDSDYNGHSDNDGNGESGHTNNATVYGGIRGRLQRCMEQHPHLAQLWTIFFNRSSGANNSNATYAPSGPAVFGAALDLSMPVLFNFHIFIQAFNHIQGPNYKGSELPVKILPVAFLAVLYARTVIPPSKRLRFWGTMKFTFTAPFHRVNVRDEFIGDSLTSWVRPGQDLLFATIYFFIVIWGIVTGRYGLTKSGDILAESWWVHNVILPHFAILPLWLKYLQTLRQAYDANQRWPYLGNAFKYLSASLVIIYGTTHPDQRKSYTWIACFLFAMFYQIVWDVVMDWQLFEIQRDISVVMNNPTGGCATAMNINNTTACSESPSSPLSLSTISSFRPDSTKGRLLLSMQMYILQPIKDRYQRLRAQIPCWRNIQLRQKRLYKTESFYWKILAFNVFTRFTWMCCFIPAYHISRSNRTTSVVVLTSTSDVNSYWGVLLPASEIFRRTLWGFLFLEKETIKMMDADAKYQRGAGAGAGAGGSYNNNNNDEEESEDEMTSINSKFDNEQRRSSFRSAYQLLPTWLDKQQQVAHNAATSRAKQQRQLIRHLFLFELCVVWAAGFVILGGLVANR